MIKENSNVTSMYYSNSCCRLFDLFIILHLCIIYYALCKEMLAVLWLPMGKGKNIPPTSLLSYASNILIKMLDR